MAALEIGTNEPRIADVDQEATLQAILEAAVETSRRHMDLLGGLEPR
jgi:hypothetical protein